MLYAKGSSTAPESAELGALETADHRPKRMCSNACRSAP